MVNKDFQSTAMQNRGVQRPDTAFIYQPVLRILPAGRRTPEWEPRDAITFTAAAEAAAGQYQCICARRINERAGGGDDDDAGVRRYNNSRRS